MSRIGFEQHQAALRADGERMAAAAALAGMASPVPSAPGWRVRDLLTHTGRVHRWAASYVRHGYDRPRPLEGDGELAAPDDELLDWFLAGHAALLDTLASADPAGTSWTLWKGAPSAREFWGRRQAHETAVHRVDAELALAAADGGPVAGGGLIEVAAEFAADGLDELLAGFIALRSRTLVSPVPVTLAVRCGDVDAGWTVRIGPDSRAVTRAAEPADCVLVAPAADLYPLLWNRAAADELRQAGRLRVDGDPAVLTLWRERARIT